MMPDMDQIYVGEDEIMQDDVEMDAGPEEMSEGVPIDSEDAWTVISSNFREKGLVRQQLDSFDMFMSSTMQVSFKFPAAAKSCVLASHFLTVLLFVRLGTH